MQMFVSIGLLKLCKNSYFQVCLGAYIFCIFIFLFHKLSVLFLKMPHYIVETLIIWMRFHWNSVICCCINDWLPMRIKLPSERTLGVVSEGHEGRLMRVEALEHECSCRMEKWSPCPTTSSCELVERRLEGL